MSSDSELVQWHKLWDDNNIASWQAVPVMMIGTESKTLIGILSFKMILIKLRIQLYIIYLSTPNINRIYIYTMIFFPLSIVSKPPSASVVKLKVLMP